jgi:ParB-like nuclease domain
MNQPLHIDPEFQSLLVPLRPEEFAGLENSIRAEGCRDPLVVWRNGKDILLDGHNRYDICKRLGAPFKVVPAELPSREAAKLWIEENQLHKRNLPDDIRAMLWVGIHERKSKLRMRERASRGGRTGGVGRPKGKSLEANVSPKLQEKQRTRAKVANEAQLSEWKLRVAAEVKKASPALAAKVLSGEVSLAAARHEIRRQKLKAELECIEAMEVKELAGLYDVLVADPPWPISQTNPSLPNYSECKYPTLSVKEIERDSGQRIKAARRRTLPRFPLDYPEIPSPCHRDAQSLGLKYVCALIWHKPGGTQPIGLPQYNCEFALYARKGTPKFIDTKAFPTCFEAPRGEHSEKPEAFYDMIRRVTAGRRADLYNRAPDTWLRWPRQGVADSIFGGR